MRWWQRQRGDVKTRETDKGGYILSSGVSESKPVAAHLDPFLYLLCIDPVLIKGHVSRWSWWGSRGWARGIQRRWHFRRRRKSSDGPHICGYTSNVARSRCIVPRTVGDLVYRYVTTFLIPISAQPLDPLPVLSDFSAEENKISELQTGFITRLRKSPYFVVETVKSNGEVVFITCTYHADSSV